ncbi:MAG: redoxin domain-containing protein [Halobacteriota archaeon]
MTSATTDLTLYRHVGCPYCERVVRRAHEMGVDYHSRWVVPEHSGRNVVKRLNGRRTVPLLVDHRTGVTMAESANIITYLERTYGDGVETPETEPGADFDVVDLPETDHVEVGETAPNFTRPLVTDEFWEDVSLDALTASGPVLLVFYPMDGTGVAQSTWIEVRERGWGDGEVEIVGLSSSSVYEHRAFIDDHWLPYRLFSDPGGGVAEQYGVTHDHDGMAGLVEARPAVYLVDENMQVDYCWVGTTWPDKPDFDEVAAAMASLAGD